MESKVSYTEIITVEEAILIQGLSLQKSGLPISFDSLGVLWERYGENHRYTMKNTIDPIVEYAVLLNKEPDYITGCAVTRRGEVGEEWRSYVIPAGKYIKDCFSGDSFQQLTSEEMMKRNVKNWAKKNKVNINNEYSLEVYPIEAVENKTVQMYTLTPILE